MENKNIDMDVKKFLNNKRYKNEISQYDYNKYSELIKRYNENKTNSKIVSEILEEFNTKLYDIKGIIIQWVKRKMNKIDSAPTIRFNLQFKLKDEQNGVIYLVKINRANAEICENLKKFEKSNIYITKMKINVTKGEMLFLNTFQTKIFIEKGEMNKYHLRDYSIDITKNNEEEFLDHIDTIGLNELLSRQDIRLHNYSEVLRKEIGQVFFDLSNLGNLLSKTQKSINLYGFISSIKVEETKKIITITSLIDSNSIKVFFYNKCYLDLKEKMIVFIKRGYVTVNKGVDIIIEIIDDSSIEARLIIDEENFKKLKKFRYNFTKDFDLLIDLVQPIIIRNINKYYVKIKRVYKVTAFIDRLNRSEYNELKDLRFKAKCLVDDGTFEAILYFIDIYVYKMFKLDSLKIDEIYDSAQINNNNFVIYDYQNCRSKNYLKFNCYEFDDIIVYAIPFSSTAHKDLFNKSYIQTYEQGSEKDKTRNFNNMIFINGDIGKELIQEEFSLPRPCIKAIHIN